MMELHILLLHLAEFEHLLIKDLNDEETYYLLINQYLCTEYVVFLQCHIRRYSKIEDVPLHNELRPEARSQNWDTKLLF